MDRSGETDVPQVVLVLYLEVREDEIAGYSFTQVTKKPSWNRRGPIIDDLLYRVLFPRDFDLGPLQLLVLRFLFADFRFEVSNRN